MHSAFPRRQKQIRRRSCVIFGNPLPSISGPGYLESSRTIPGNRDAKSRCRWDKSIPDWIYHWSPHWSSTAWEIAAAATQR